MHDITGQPGTSDFHGIDRPLGTWRLPAGEGRDRLGPVPAPARGAEFDEVLVQQLVQLHSRCADQRLKQPQCQADHQLHVLIGLKAFHASRRQRPRRVTTTRTSHRATSGM